MPFLASTVYGYFIVDEKGGVLLAQRSDGGDSAISALLEEAGKKGLGEVYTYEPHLAKWAKLVSPHFGSAELYSHTRFAEALGLSVDEVLRIVRTKALEDTRVGVARESGRKDRIIAQNIKAVDEFDKTLNIFVSRVREWYGLHFPELNELVEDPASYLRLVHTLGLRHNYTPERLMELGYQAEMAKRLAEAAASSTGAPFSEEEVEPIRTMAGAVYQLYSLREKLSKYTEELMLLVAPNLAGLAGPALGARLIASAGDLERLAKLPSSTVQVLGAEKALFRAIRKGAKPPKHGVIFQEPLIHNAPRWQRGKIARAFAGKLSIAARLDFYGGDDVSDRLRAEFEERVEKVKQLFAKPPKRVAGGERVGVRRDGGGRRGRGRGG
ncbi:MAG: C/D box methylation guide ribonucleoprotein complex aNOP56 subunit [Thermoprotei archaeon]